MSQSIKTKLSRKRKITASNGCLNDDKVDKKHELDFIPIKLTPLSPSTIPNSNAVEPSEASKVVQHSTGIIILYIISIMYIYYNYYNK